MAMPRKSNKKKNPSLNAHRNQDSIEEPGDCTNEEQPDQEKEESTLFDECIKLFASNDFYVILNVPKTCDLTESIFFILSL
jgi:hypothetical protein